MKLISTNIFKGRIWLMLIILPFFSSCRTVKTFQATGLSLSHEERIADLDNELPETSGLEFYKDSLVSFNDSGGETRLFVFPPHSPGKMKSFMLSEAENVDWEDIARGGGYYYIGDFGNNFGSRDTMIIYRFAENDIDLSPVKPDIISFSFTEKLPEFKNMARNPFDCEAMAFINDSVWLFTKNWRDKSSWVYTLPAMPGHYDLEVREVLNPRMLVTGADYIPEEELLILIGYQHFSPRIRIYRHQNNTFEEIILLRLCNLFGTQTEGIVVRDNIIYFSNEKSLRKQGLYRLYMNY